MAQTKEQILEQGRRHKREAYRANPEKFRTRNRVWAAQNREWTNRYSREWYRNNPAARAHKAEYLRAQMLTIRKETFEAYGNKCSCCGVVEQEFLSIDHINGRAGHSHPKKLTGWKFYKWLKERGFPQDEFRLLCFNCNCSLGFWGYCPHTQVQQ